MNAYIWVGFATELGILVYLAVYLGSYLEKNQDWAQATLVLLVVFFMTWILQLIFLVKKWQESERLKIIKK